MKIAYVRTGGRGGGVQTNAYALRTGGGGGGHKLANFCVRTLWMAPYAKTGVTISTSYQRN